MRKTAGKRGKPLPLREGVDPVCFRLPQRLPSDWEGRPAVEIFLERFDRSREFLAAQVAAGTVVDDDGTPLTWQTPARPGLGMWSYRPLPAEEAPVPLDMPRLYQDDNILVIDKPHFLPTIPRGKFVTHTALVQLRRELAAEGSQQAAACITPAHRLDRHTAGVLLFTLRPDLRGTVQKAFEDGQARKTYFAIAPLPGASTDTAAGTPAAATAAQLAAGAPIDVRSRIEVSRNRLDCYETAGPVNAHTTIELVQQRNGYGLYRITPHTGKTHQIRVHMNHIGVPLVGDPLYPRILPDRPDDPTDPRRTLQLLAADLTIPTPAKLSIPSSFHSQRGLHWPDGEPTGSLTTLLDKGSSHATD